MKKKGSQSHVQGRIVYTAITVIRVCNLFGRTFEIFKARRSVILVVWADPGASVAISLTPEITPSQVPRCLVYNHHRDPCLQFVREDI